MLDTDGQCVNRCPTPDFEDASNFDVSVIAVDSPTNYILKVNLEYPQHLLLDAHVDISFCPMRDKSPDTRQDELLATLYI